MATYILLLTLTPEGQQAALNDPEYLRRVEDAIRVPGVQTLGLYAVLGEYDFVTIVEAENNERVGRFSIELGVRAKVHVTSLPAIAASRLHEAANPETLAAEVETPAEQSTPTEVIGKPIPGAV